MPTTKRDLQALTYLARRIRQETHGAGEWDETGTYAVLTSLEGQHLPIVVERVTRHAMDPEAKTPGAIRRPFTPPAPEQTKTRVEPKVGEACWTCGRHLDNCLCETQPTTRKTAGTPPTDAFTRAREALRRKP